jgi:hypothetical protein
MTDHITAAELRARADRMTSKRVGKSEAYRRAAAALDALDARIAELEEEVELARTGWAKPQWTADAELGALVREVGAHPEAKGRCHVVLSADQIGVPDSAFALNASAMRLLRSHLDSLAASREAEQGVEGPSGWRWRVTRHGPYVSLHRNGNPRPHYRYVVGMPSLWRDEVPPCDHPTVAALIAKHNNGGTE